MDEIPNSATEWMPARRRLSAQSVAALLRGDLSVKNPAMSNYRLTERQYGLLGDCAHANGGYGCPKEYIVAQMWADARVQHV